jgi:hypothetical protein
VHASGSGAPREGRPDSLSLRRRSTASSRRRLSRRPPHCEAPPCDVGSRTAFAVQVFAPNAGILRLRRAGLHQPASSRRARSSASRWTTAYGKETSRVPPTEGDPMLC